MMASKRITLLAVILAIVLGLASQAEPLHLWVKNPGHWTQGAEIYSCLAYQGCDQTTFEIDAENILHIYTNQSIDQIKIGLKKCELSSTRASTIYYQKAQSQEITTISISANKMRPKTRLAPMLISKSLSNSLIELTDKIRQSALSDQVQKILEYLSIRSFEYRVAYSPMKDVLAVVNSDTKTVTFDSNFDASSDPGDVVAGVVHEYTHVFQQQLIKKCGEVNTTFFSHSNRERAAYLQSALVYQYMGDQQRVDWAISELKNYTSNTND